MEKEKVKEILIKNGQNHIAEFYDKVDAEKKKEIEKQVEKIDFELLNKLYQNVTINNKQEESVIAPIEYTDKDKICKEDKERYIRIGEEKIRQGKLAAVTMAGGQGTRLGHNGPKGTYILDTYEKKSLFQILCESLKNANSKYNVVIPWYIMTSIENNDETEKFFKDNNTSCRWTWRRI